MPSDTLSRGARGGSVIVAGQFAKLGLQLLGVVVLSRLLSPADFGLVAMISVFLALGSLLRDFGMPTAALQARSLSSQQASNFFWLSTLLGSIAALLLAAVSPLLAGIYEEPRLVVIGPAMAVTLLLNGVQAQIQVQLARGLRFVTLATTDLVSQALALTVAIALAWSGFGYWAIVVQAIMAPSLLLILRWVAVRWRPNLPRRGHGSAGLFRSGWDLGLAQFLAFAANNADTFAIGVHLGAGQLGIYNRAFQLYSIPRSGMLDPLTQVVLPVINRLTAEGGRSASMLLRRLQFALSGALTLVFVVVAATAEYLVPLVLGNQWGAAVAPLQILAFGGFFAAFGTVSYWVFLLEHKSRSLLYLHLITKPIMIVFVLLGLPFGIVGVAAGYAIAQAVAWPINLIWLARVASQDSWSFLRVGLRTIFAGLGAFIVARISTDWLDLPGLLWPTLVGGLVAASGFIILLVAVPGGTTEIASTVQIARALRARRNPA